MQTMPVQNFPLMGKGQRPLRLAQAVAVDTAKIDIESEELKLLKQGALAIIQSQPVTLKAVQGTYDQYKGKMDRSTFDRIVSSLPLTLFYKNVYQFIAGNSNHEAVVKLEAAKSLGYHWIREVKSKWFDAPGDGGTLHENLIAVDDNLAKQVEAKFDEMIYATANVVTLTGEIQLLTETLITEAILTFFGTAGKAVADLASSLALIGQAMLALIKALAQFSNKASESSLALTALPFVVVAGIIAAVLFIK